MKPHDGPASRVRWRRDRRVSGAQTCPRVPVPRRGLVAPFARSVSDQQRDRDARGRSGPTSSTRSSRRAHVRRRAAITTCAGQSPACSTGWSRTTVRALARAGTPRRIDPSRGCRFSSTTPRARRLLDMAGSCRTTRGTVCEGRRTAPSLPCCTGWGCGSAKSGAVRVADVDLTRRLLVVRRHEIHQESTGALWAADSTTVLTDSSRPTRAAGRPR